MTPILLLDGLSASIGGRLVLEEISLAIAPGEIHALVGPNGSGKSSLASIALGHPDYTITSGTISICGEDARTLATDARSNLGIFLSFQDPPEIGGVALDTFLKMIAPKGGSVADTDALVDLRLDKSFLRRFLNEGFSGGERKKSELLQLLARRPKLAILDEIDAGLDVDALASAVRILRRVADGGASLLLISHAPRLFELIAPDRVHVLTKGRIVASGGHELIADIKEHGYGGYE